jgi:hypothetical protein
MTTALVDYTKEKSLGADRFVTLAGRVNVSECTIRNIADEHIRELDKKASVLGIVPGFSVSMRFTSPERDQRPAHIWWLPT